MLVQVLLGLLVQTLLHQLQLLGHGRFQRVQRHHGLLAVVAAHQHALAGLHIPGADLHAQGHALHLILGALPAHGVVGIVHLHPHAGRLQAIPQGGGRLQNAGLVLGHGQDDDLDGRDFRGQDQTVVVAVGHDHRTDHASGGAPGGLERILQLVVPAGEGHAIGAGELIAKVVGGGALEGLAVLHHALHGVGGLRAGELLLLGLAAAHHGDGQHVFIEIGVAVELLLGFRLGLLGGLMDGVALLPPELTGAQEGAGGLLPADDGAPLVVEHGQLPIGVEHAGPVVAEHGLGGGTESQALLQLLIAAHGDPGALGRKAVHQLALFFQQALGDQHRHGHVHMPGLFKLRVHQLLHILPDRIAVRPQDREALDRRIFHQLRLAADIGIPLSKIDLHIGDLLNFFLFRHL